MKRATRKPKEKKGVVEAAAPEFSPPELPGYAIERLPAGGIRIRRNDGGVGADILLRFVAIAIFVGLFIFFWQLTAREKWYARAAVIAFGCFAVWVSYLTLRAPAFLFFEFYPDKIIVGHQALGRQAQETELPIHGQLDLAVDYWSGTRGGHMATLWMPHDGRRNELMSFGSALNRTRAREQMEKFVDFLREELRIPITLAE
ncbi:MAG: hypothetical protein U1F16_01715 [Turneriella sp.]